MDDTFSILIHQEVKKLHETIKEFNNETSKYSKRMLILTWLIAILTIILVFGLIIQIWISLK